MKRKRSTGSNASKGSKHAATAHVVKKRKGCLAFRGQVIEDLPGDQFRVSLDIEGFEDKQIMNAYISGQMRFHRIRVIKGDFVIVEIPEEGDSSCGRIVSRDRLSKMDIMLPSVLPS